MTPAELLRLVVAPVVIEFPLSAAKKADPFAAAAFLVAAATLRGGLGERFVGGGEDNHSGNTPRGPWRLKLALVRDIVRAPGAAAWFAGALDRLGYPDIADAEGWEWHKWQGIDPQLAALIVMKAVAADRAPMPALDDAEGMLDLYNHIFAERVRLAAFAKAYGPAVDLVKPAAPPPVEEPEEPEPPVAPPPPPPPPPPADPVEPEPEEPALTPA